MGLFDDWFVADNSVGGTTTEDYINWDQTPEEQAEQEYLGQSILEASLEGRRQEDLGTGIVQESLGQSLVDGFLGGQTNDPPWLRTIDATLGSAARTVSQVDRLLGPTNRITAPGGIPREVAQSDRVNPILSSVRKYLAVYPPSQQGGALALPRRQPAATFSLIENFDGTNLVLLGLGAYLVYRLLK